MTSGDYGKIVSPELDKRQILYEKLDCKARKLLKPIFESDLSLAEFSRENLKIPEIGLKYQGILDQRIKAIRDKKVEMLQSADNGE